MGSCRHTHTQKDITDKVFVSLMCVWLRAEDLPTQDSVVAQVDSGLTFSRKFSSSRWVLVTLLEEESDHDTCNTPHRGVRQASTAKTCS